MRGEAPVDMRCKDPMGLAGRSSMCLARCMTFVYCCAGQEREAEHNVGVPAHLHRRRWVEIGAIEQAVIKFSDERITLMSVRLNAKRG